MPSNATVTLLGHAGKDSQFTEGNESKKIPNRVSVSVATTKWNGAEKKEITTWWNVTGWRHVADRIENFHKGIRKGDLVYVVGTPSTREYVDRNGQTKIALDVDATAIEVVPKGGAVADDEDVPF